MENYAKKLPSDRTDTPLQEFAVPFPALATLHRENATTSSVTNLNANTTSIEVTAATLGAAIRWVMQSNDTATSSVITAAGTAAFDNFIPAGVTRRFVVPRNSAAIPNYSGIQNPSVVGLNTSEGLYNGVATKSVGVGSVLVTQY